MSEVRPKPYVSPEKPDEAYTDRARFEKLEKVLELKENVQEVLQGRGFFKENFMLLPEVDIKNHTVAKEGKMPGSAKKAASKASHEYTETLSPRPAKKKKTH